MGQDRRTAAPAPVRRANENPHPAALNRRHPPSPPVAASTGSSNRASGLAGRSERRDHRCCERRRWLALTRRHHRWLPRRGRATGRAAWRVARNAGITDAASRRNGPGSPDPGLRSPPSTPPPASRPSSNTPNPAPLKATLVAGMDLGVRTLAYGRHPRHRHRRADHHRIPQTRPAPQHTSRNRNQANRSLSAASSVCIQQRNRDQRSGAPISGPRHSTPVEIEIRRTEACLLPLAYASNSAIAINDPGCIRVLQSGSNALAYQGPGGPQSPVPEPTPTALGPRKGSRVHPGPAIG